MVSCKGARQNLLGGGGVEGAGETYPAGLYTDNPLTWQYH